MRRCGNPLAVVVLASGVILGPGVAAGASEVDDRVALTFADERIDESSGLVDAGVVMHTVNDSGDDPVVYTVDKRTGETTAVTTYSSDDVDDVEALASGRGPVVWVGDIGDNSFGRPSVDVYRVRLGASEGENEQEADRFRLTYPDGAHDAEALLADPRTGRLYVVSKSITGGSVYAAPARLEPGETNEMVAIARVSGLVTGGAFFPDGRHVLLRSYGTASVYAFPGFEQVDRVSLPAQEQGEAVAIGRQGRIYLSSEGANSDVLEVGLPAALQDAVQGTGSVSPSPSVRPDRRRDDRPGAAGPGSRADEGAGVWIAAGVAGLAPMPST